QAGGRGRAGAGGGPGGRGGARTGHAAGRQLPGGPIGVGRGVRVEGRTLCPSFAAAGDVRHAVRAPPAAGAAGRSRCARLDAGGDGGRRDMSVRDAYLVAALRTPVGRYGGALAPVRPDDMAATVLREVVGRPGVPSRSVADVVLGCANQAGEDQRNVARMAARLAGYRVRVPGVTVNRLCGSGLEDVAQAARGVKLGEGELFVG